MQGSVIEELVRRFSLNLESQEGFDPNSGFDGLVESFAAVLAKAGAKAGEGGGFILLLDAVDQLGAFRSPQNLYWLPAEPPPNVKVLMSSLPLAIVGSAESRGFTRVELPPLNETESGALVNGYLGQFGKKLDARQMQALLEHRGAKAPLYLRTASEELRQHGRFENLGLKIRRFPETTDALFAQMLESIEADQGSEFVKLACSLVVVSRYGLTEEELLALLAPEGSERLPVAYLSSFQIRLRAYLRRGDDGARIVFFHRQLAEAVESRYLDASFRAKIHIRLALWLEAKARGEAGDREWEAGYAAGLSEAPWHFIQTDRLEDAVAIMTDFAYLMNALKAGLLEDVLSTWNLLSVGRLASELRDWTVFFRENAHLLRRADPSWTADRILLELASEHGLGSPLTKAADGYLLRGRVDWLWLRRRDRAFEPASSRCLTVMEGHEARVIQVIQFSDGSIASASEDGTLRFWDKYGALSLTVPICDRASVDSIHVRTQIFPDDTFLALLMDGSLRLWTREGRPLVLFEGHEGRVTGFRVLKSGRIASWAAGGASSPILEMAPRFGAGA